MKVVILCFLDIAFFRNYRDRLIGLLLENITHLDIMFYQSDSIEHRNRVRFALEKLENTRIPYILLNLTIQELI